MKRIIMATAFSMVNKDYAATVEAEYGDFCIEGTKVTLAHHGSRSNNPAPCCWTRTLPVLEDGDEILVSHIDPDTIGGCLALLGIKPECKEFWEAVSFIDVNATHHLHELPQIQQDMFNAWRAKLPTVPRYNKLTDVTNLILEQVEVLERIIALEPTIIEEGRKWAEQNKKDIESKLLGENQNVRAFVTDGTFCSAAYYSENFGVVPATITLNTVTKGITIGFADGGKLYSARELVQKLWGPEAGGHNGVAGSPRGWEKTALDLLKEFEIAISTVENLYK